MGWVSRFGRTFWRKTPLSRDVRCGRRCVLIAVGVGSVLAWCREGRGTGEGRAARSGVASCAGARWHRLRGWQRCGRTRVLTRLPLLWGRSQHGSLWAEVRASVRLCPLLEALGETLFPPLCPLPGRPQSLAHGPPFHLERWLVVPSPFHVVPALARPPARKGCSTFEDWRGENGPIWIIQDNFCI